MDIPIEQQTTFGPRGSKKIQPLKPFTLQRHQHRDAEADADNSLPTYCRYRDLVEAGIVSNRMQLARMIANEGFPAGFKLSANIHVFDVNAVRRFLQAEQDQAQK